MKIQKQKLRHGKSFLIKHFERRKAAQKLHFPEKAILTLPLWWPYKKCELWKMIFFSVFSQTWQLKVPCPCDSVRRLEFSLNNTFGIRTTWEQNSCRNRTIPLMSPLCIIWSSCCNKFSMSFSHPARHEPAASRQPPSSYSSPVSRNCLFPCLWVGETASRPKTVSHIVNVGQKWMLVSRRVPR